LTATANPDKLEKFGVRALGLCMSPRVYRSIDVAEFFAQVMRRTDGSRPQIPSMIGLNGRTPMK
jgi:hypothetical protein